MLEINMFRNNPELIRKDHDKRGLPHDAIDMVIALDQEWINLQHETINCVRKRTLQPEALGRRRKQVMRMRQSEFWQKLRT